MAIRPSTLPIKEFKLREIGVIAAGALSGNGWTALRRIPVVPQIGKVILEETDFSWTEGDVNLIEEAINHVVIGSPAILRMKKSNGGGEATELFWSTDTKMYRIITNRMLSENASKYLIQLASSIGSN